MAALAALFNTLEMPWLIAFLGSLGAQQFDTDSFCATDPPPDPGMTALDWANVLNVGATVLNVEALRKASQLVAHYLWFVLCKCDAGAQPTPPSPISPPSGLPLVNPPGVGPTYPTDQPCAAYTYTWQLAADESYTPDPIILPLPTGGVTTVRLTARQSRPMVSGETGWQVLLNEFNSSGTFIGSAAHVEASGTGSSLTMTGSLISGGATWRAYLSPFGVATPVTIETDVEFFCGAPGGGNVPQPCPEDPITLTLLDQILQLVRLIQRQAVPFAYIASTAHSALTGQGEIAVQGLIGVRVLVTQMGAGVGVDDGNPDTLWSAGHIRWGNDDGWDRTVWIDASPITSIPTSAGQYTRVGYTLSPGVEVTITELVREA